MEIWKAIEDFPEYEVSNCGNVRSVDRDFIDSWGRSRHKKGQLLKLTYQKDKKSEYIQVMTGICSNHKSYRLIVARLVAKTFIPNPNNYPQVNHKDENSLNNNVDNLEWCTCEYNIKYNGLKNRQAKKKCCAIDVYNKELKFLETVSSGIEASNKYNVSRSLISQSCNGILYFAKNYHFEFHL